MKKIEDVIRNIGKWIEGVLQGTPPEPAPVRVTVRR